MATPVQVPPRAVLPATPVGRDPLPHLLRSGSEVRLSFHDGAAVLHGAHQSRRFPLGTMPDPTTCSGVRAVVVDVPVPPEAAAWLLGLAATGTVLLAGPASPSPGWDVEVHGVAVQPLPPADDPIGWERRSVGQRRAALSAARCAAGVALPPVSAVLCTRRPRMLADALGQLAGMRYPRLHVVVVCHGPGFTAPLVAAARERAGGLDVEVIHAGDDIPFGAALQAGCERAEGRLLTKVDDDDGYGPWHVTDLVLAHAYSGATVVGKFPSAVYLEGIDQTVWRDDHPPERFDATVAGGTLLLGRDDLAAAGGWRPVGAGVDTYLLEAVRAGGGSVYRTHPLGYLLTRHSDGHTWQVDDGAFLRTSTRQWLGRYEGTLER